MVKKAIMAAAAILSAAFFILSASAAARADVDTLDEIEKVFKPAEACSKCHSDVYQQWKKSVHGESVLHSLEGIYQYVAEGILKEPDRQKRSVKAEAMKCFVCHAPMLDMASEKLMGEVLDSVKQSYKHGLPDAKKKSARETLARLNVSCFVCHNAKAVHPPGKPDQNTMYGVKAAGSSPFHSVKKTAFLDNAIFCMQCHGVYTAPDREQIICSTISQSYRDQYVAAGGQETCQDCHMRKKNRGHAFPGAYVLDTLKDSVTMLVNVRTVKDLPIDSTKWFPAAAVTIDLTNNAGHRLPDGCLWTARIVMDITAKDERGQTVWSRTEEFFQPGLDIEGNRTYNAWQIKDMLDFTLPPRKTTTKKYFAVFPEGAGKINLEVRLRYIHKKGIEFIMQNEKRTLRYE